MLNAFDGGFTGSLTVTVTIADVNEPPMVDGAAARAPSASPRTAGRKSAVRRHGPRGAGRDVVAR